MTIDEYRVKLMDKIAKARSKREILKYVDTAIAAMHKKKVHGHIVARFIEKVLLQLDTVGEDPDPIREQNFVVAKEIVVVLKKELMGQRIK